jgi:hypothetical protein
MNRALALSSASAFKRQPKQHLFERAQDLVERECSSTPTSSRVAHRPLIRHHQRSIVRRMMSGFVQKHLCWMHPEGPQQRRSREQQKVFWKRFICSPHGTGLTVPHKALSGLDSTKTGVTIRLILPARRALFHERLGTLDAVGMAPVLAADLFRKGVRVA